LSSSASAITVLVIFGPTACGKTSLLERLFASRGSPLFGRAEVISADSMQVYKGLDTGTAKPPRAMLDFLPHYLIDIVSPHEQFTAGDFVREADALCANIALRGRLPVVAGGTGFYIRNFLLGLPLTPQGTAGTRNALKARVKTEGARALHAELALRDPQSARRIHENDAYRIARALEVCADSGKPLSAFAPPVTLRTTPAYNFFTVCMTRARAELYERIDARVEAMFEAGLQEEAERLMRAGYTAGDPGMRAIGYREFFDAEVLRAHGSEKTLLAKELIKRATKRYAKRQITYMKGIPGAQFVAADDFAAFESIARAHAVQRFKADFFRKKPQPCQFL
jgi:tRNA dimethylallyltransferase